jgi:hypothetical protein
MFALVIIAASVAVVVATTAYHAGFCNCMAFVYETEGESDKASDLRRERVKSVVRGGILAAAMSGGAVYVAWLAP